MDNRACSESDQGGWVEPGRRAWGWQISGCLARSGDERSLTALHCVVLLSPNTQPDLRAPTTTHRPSLVPILIAPSFLLTLHLSTFSKETKSFKSAVITVLGLCRCCQKRESPTILAAIYLPSFVPVYQPSPSIILQSKRLNLKTFSISYLRRCSLAKLASKYGVFPPPPVSSVWHSYPQNYIFQHGYRPCFRNGRGKTSFSSS